MKRAENVRPKGATSYLVNAAPPPAAPRRKVAVFVAHGMGQQIRFETLDQVSEGLRAYDRAMGHENGKPISRTLKVGEQWIQRVEVPLKQDAEAVEAHVYEGYWAPLTEGRVTLRDVVRFLAGAGGNGVRNAKTGQFRRYVFDRFTSFPIAVRTMIYLLVALATVAALVVINSTIAVVSAGRALLSTTPRWLSDGLFLDLTTMFNAVITTMAILALAIGVGAVMRAGGIPRPVRSAWSWLSIIPFYVAVSAVILAGVAIPLLFYGHVRGGAAPQEQLWQRLLAGDRITAFNAGFDLWAWRIAIVIAAVLALRWVASVAMGLVRDLSRSRGRWRTLLVSTVFVVVLYAAYRLVMTLSGIGGSAGVAALRTGLAWALLVGASAFVRQVLVQFLGDVAAYITPYKLDAFTTLRKEVKECVYKTMRAVYEMKDGYDWQYQQVIVVGHSLGSVVSYDALNQLIRDDLASAGALGIVERTPLLLTFGSPLDKTAFIFAVQKGTEARESLATSVQPLIQSYAYRPKKWINIHSPWDIISGELGFYDSPVDDEATRSQRVRNEADPDATTLLVAHTEYWKNPLVFQRIHEELGVRAHPALGYQPTGGPVFSAAHVIDK